MSSAPTDARRRPSRLRFVRYFLIFLLLLLASLAIPDVFRFVVRTGLELEAHRRDAFLSIGSVQGSLWEPVVLHGVRWDYRMRRGGLARSEITNIEADFAWQELFSRNGGHWFRRLTFDGVNGKVDLPPNPDVVGVLRGPGIPGWLPMPARLEIKGVELMVATGDDFIRFQGGRLAISEFEPGEVHLAQIVVKQPWLSHTFRDVHGTTAVQGSRAVVADLTLEPGVIVKTFAAEMEDLARGQINAELQIAAFGGVIRAQARTLTDERLAGNETSGNFSQIGIAPLATFLGLSDAAGGTIKEGKFTFRGSLRNLPRASASVRLEATNFQWESRQWDSLVLGATLMDQRVQIPELELHQGHNHLSLSGDMMLPATHTEWWQSEFAFNVAAKIDNLTELSALLLPEFKFAAGKINVDGAVRGKDQQFNGALIVSGSDITWRNAPIEELHAALKITGNELQVANFEFLNKRDFVRGRGVVNILGAKQYWGEVRGSVEDLASYAALLQPPVFPEPLAGGAVIDWSGEGSAKGHSGKFFARLQKLRTLGATGAFIHPLQAELDGVYSEGNLQFSRFGLSDEESAFTANVAVGNKGLSLKGVKLTHGQEVWLQGDAVLPLDVWHAWPNTALAALLTEGVPSKIDLTAQNLQLREASQLTGWKWPIEGVLNGTVHAEGVVGALNSSGQVTLSAGRLPLGQSGDALTKVEAAFSLAGQTLKIDKFTGQHSSGSYTSAGQIDFTNLRDTTLKLAVQSEAATLPLFRGIGLKLVRSGAEGAVVERADHLDLATHLDLKVEGLASAATVSGGAEPLAIELPGLPDLTGLWKAEQHRALPLPFAFATAPWSAWKLDVQIKSPGVPVKPDAGTASVDLHLTGTGHTPVVAGTVRVENGHAMAATGPLQVDLATVEFRDGTPQLALAVSGTYLGSEFNATVTGPLSAPLHTFEAVPPLTPEILQQALAGEIRSEATVSKDGSFSLEAPAILTGDAVSYPWTAIRTEEIPNLEAVPGPAPTPAPAAAPESAPPSAGTNPTP